jgi:hypothetical protein
VIGVIVFSIFFGIGVTGLTAYGMMKERREALLG